MAQQNGRLSIAHRASAEASFGDLVRDATENISTLVRSEIELAKLEVTASVKRAGIGGALLGVAALMLLLSLPFLFVALAEGLVAAGLLRWAAYLIVFALFVLIAALMALVAIRKMKRIGKPERTITTVKETAQALRRGHG